MELEKSESVLGSLYALRAGLSAISVDYDKARKLDEDYYEKLNVVADQAGGARYEAPSGTLEYAKWLCDGSFRSELNQRYNRIYAKHIEKEESNVKYYDYAEKKTKCFVFMAIFLVVAVALSVGICFISARGIDTGVLVFLCSFLAGAFIAAIIFMCKGIGYSRENKNYNLIMAQINKSYNEKVKSEEQRVSRERQALKNNINRLPQVKEEVQAVLKQRSNEITPIVQSCNVFYKALLEQFTPILDERDWQHLDLVIYEIETRRADNVKEALQLVDRELQTQRIEHTLGEATRAICYTLQRGFVALQQSIKVCCQEICGRLDSISSQLDTLSLQMTVQSIQLARISGQLAELTDSVNVGNALQAKANENSAQLVDDVYALRYFNTDMIVK